MTPIKCKIPRKTGSDNDSKSYSKPVYIESRVCVVKGVVKCSFEYLCVVCHDTRRRHNEGVGEGTIKKNS